MRNFSTIIQVALTITCVSVALTSSIASAQFGPANQGFPRSDTQSGMLYQAPANTTAASSAPAIRWRDNLGAARLEAGQSGKLILLHFYSDDCVFCEKLEMGAYRDPALIAAIEQKFVPVKIYGPSNAKAAATLNVTRYPTDVVLDVEGHPLLRTVSPQDPQSYIAMLGEAEKKRQQLLGGRLAQTDAAPAPAPLDYPAPTDAGQSRGSNPTAARLASNSKRGEPAVPTLDLQSQEPMMEGYCMVTMVDQWQWQLGNPEIAAMHLGRLYLFTTTSAREKFLSDPMRYTPVMNGLDVVEFLDAGRIVPGVRAIGCKLGNPERIFFFSSEQSRLSFETAEATEPRYSSPSIELFHQAAADANPGR
jgi:protein disulfide-isomerase